MARAAAAIALATAGLTGCALGERPSLGEAPTAAGDMTGDPPIDDVLERLDQVGTAQFGAEYTAVQAMGGATSTVRVAQQSATQRSVTVGDVRFLTNGAGTKTCDLATGMCEEGILAQRISNTGIQTPNVVFGDLAKRLRLDAVARAGPSSTTEVEIAGQPALCVDVRLSRGTVRYCAMANGVIARYSGGDFSLDLVSYAPTPDASLFLETRDA
jgi:hypothetical protein